MSALFSDVVDSFHFRAVWILSARRLSGVRFVSRCCGFFRFDVIIVVVVIVVVNISASRSPPPVQLGGMHRHRTAFTVAIAVAKARLFYRLFTLRSPRLAPPWRVPVSDGCHCLKALSPEPLAGAARVSCQTRRKPRTVIPAPTAPRPPRMISDGNTSSSSEQKMPLFSNARRRSCWILRVWTMQRRCSKTDGAGTWRAILIRSA